MQLLYEAKAFLPFRELFERQNNMDLRWYLPSNLIKIPSLTLTSKLWAVRVFHASIGNDPSNFSSNYDLFKYVK